MVTQTVGEMVRGTHNQYYFSQLAAGDQYIFLFFSSSPLFSIITPIWDASI
jgi:hypothetical protein